MSKLIKNLIIYILIIGIVIAVLITGPKPIVQYAENIISYVKEYSSTQTESLKDLREELFTQPLRSFGSGTSKKLLPSQIIQLTNNERTIGGVSTLLENSDLDRSAMLKVQDMFDRQYFEHISPDGKGPGALADTVGYAYIVVGENLALGNFDGDAALVKAWMDSPGHRANILNTRFMEIGVAVGEGVFNGQRVWLAVQEFGKPADSCPAISTALRTSIEKQKIVVDGMNADLGTSKKQLDAMPHNTPADNTAYNQKVASYNAQVAAYNVALTDLRKNIDDYNTQVKSFNSCAKE